MKFSCPRCAHALEACRSFIGFSVRCPGCHHPVAVPKEGQTTSIANPPPNEPDLPPAIPAADAGPALSPERRNTRRLGIPVAIAAAIVLSGIALTVKNAGSPTPPPPLPSSSEVPSPKATSSPADPVQPK